MIFVRDKGQMCNNLLQFAHVYAWALEHGRKSVSMRFCYKYPYFHIRHTAWHNPVVYALAKFLGWIKILPIVSYFYPQDTNNQQKEQMMINNRYVLVEGWYVRFYDLFIKYKSDILKIFAFDSTIKENVNKLLSSEEGIRLGVHIRRGDYKTFHNGDFFYTDEEYIDIIQQFLELKKGTNVTIYICGNDPSLQESLYKEKLKDVNIVFPKGNPGEDLCLLSECNYLIGPPSTFSLVASMYKNIPLYWIKDKNKRLTESDFDFFDNLFKKII